MDGRLHRIVIIGGGFAGIQAARSLRDMPVHLTLIDRQDFNLFQPMIVQVATGILGPTEITTPLRFIFRSQDNIDILLAEVKDFDPARGRVILESAEVEYDTLVVAAGSKTNYFGQGNWARLAPSLKTVSDAVEIRRRIFSAMEAAEHEPDEARRRELLTYVVVGGGFTGMALSGMIADITARVLVKEYEHVSSREITVILLEAADRVLPQLPASFSRLAQEALRDVGVTVRAGSLVTEVEEGGIIIEHAGKRERISARTVLWAAGVDASDLASRLASRTGARQDRHGRVMVRQDLSIPGHGNIFVIGDLAHFSSSGKAPLPPFAAVASQQGRYVGTLIGNRILGKELCRPFSYRGRGVTSVIGRRSGIVKLGPFAFKGFPAWLVWLFANLFLLKPLENRLLVLTRWLFLSFGNNLSARQLTAEEAGLLPPSS